MVNDSVDAHFDFLRLSDAEHDLAKATDPNFPKTAKVYTLVIQQETDLFLRENSLTLKKFTKVIISSNVKASGSEAGSGEIYLSLDR